ncbi:gamma-glutamylcyclotransferase family protein [Rhodanobacter sp. DHB23]|uniref:gamma-glutamylcyclotransferase family protein n=1 Tax=Rhodanobacter sp. DHB23 TaxID=2775923 RepID=UPI001780519A|nr:gamma-glutamylcyclotransferase family protein [Rhodanobacter sp. DHB23]MBD8874155.1 gamma-glutamylcyclotransferase [Rhodanobacter sp. DHB23]
MEVRADALLFSYGTLQSEAVQLAIFGRRLDGVPDALPGYRLEQLAIRNAQVVATSGAAQHPIAVPSADPADFVRGVVFRLTPRELAQADAYEVDDYRRAAVVLASGLRAWMYVRAE